MIETYSLYNGEVTLVYDSAKHAYYEGGVKIDGVTSATGKIDKSGALMWWAVKDVTLPYLFGNEKAHTKPGKPKFPGLIKPGVAYDEIDLMNFQEEAGKQYNNKKKEAAGVGTLIHDWCEQWIKADINFRRPEGSPIIYPLNLSYPERSVSPVMVNGTQAFLNFVADHKVIFLHSERKIFSRLHRYSGTMDFEAIITPCGKTTCTSCCVDGVLLPQVPELSIGDLKTSNHLVTEYRYQVSAYLNARKEETGNEYKAYWILRLGKEAGVSLVNGEPEVEFESRRNDISEFDEDFKTFLAALQILRREKKLNPRQW